jgi:hypothetical protein
MLWRICSKQQLWSQRNSRSWAMTARNNRYVVTIGDVTRTAIFVERLFKHVHGDVT